VEVLMDNGKRISGDALSDIMSDLNLTVENLNETDLIILLKHMLFIIAQKALKDGGLQLDLFYEAEKFGLHVLPTHFYSPIPNTHELAEQVWDSYDVSDLNYNSGEMCSLLDKISKYKDEVVDIAITKECLEDGINDYYYENPAFHGMDAIIYYYMIRYFKPKRLVEIGCGYSTLIAAKAVLLNKVTEFVCIEPYPPAFINEQVPGINKLITKFIQDIPIAFFEALESGDILFIDSSHVSKTGSDVNYIFLRVLPKLKQGVIIHFHDILIPYEVQADWVKDLRLFWNEQYLLHTLLSASEQYRTVMPNHYMGKRFPFNVASCLPNQPDNVGRSYWIVKGSLPLPNEEPEFTCGIVDYSPPVDSNPQLRLTAALSDMEREGLKDDSVEWWDAYFSRGLWDICAGGEQTAFFANLTLNNIPCEIISDIGNGHLSICDVGCAQGDALPIFASFFPNSKCYGMDFSSAALKNATKKYSNYTFVQDSLETMSESYDVLYCSAVLEHFTDPWNQLKLIMKNCNRYAIILIPFREKPLHETHFYSFDEEFFAKKSAQFRLKSLEIVDASKLPNSYWDGEMAVAVYEKDFENKMADENTSQATPSVWDNVAKQYSINIDDGEYEIAKEIVTVLKLHGIEPGSKILELGCGSGHLSACLAMAGYNTALLDFSPKSLEKAKQTYDEYGLQGEFIQGDIMNLDAYSENNYDLVWNSGVMEHFSDDTIFEAFSNIKKVAHHNLFILVPNPLSISYLLMRYVRQSQDDWPYGMEYLRTDYDKALEAIGFNDIKTHYLAKAATRHNFWVATKDAEFNDAYDDLLYHDLLPVHEQYLVGYLASSDSNDSNISITHTFNADMHTHLYDLNSERYSLFKERNKLAQQLLKAQQEKDTIARELNIQIEQLVLEQKQLELDHNLQIEQLELERNKVANVRNITNDLMRGRTLKAVHLWSRLKNQLLLGSLSEKRMFFYWIKTRIGRLPFRGKSFHPLSRILDAIDSSASNVGGAPHSYQTNLSENEVIDTQKLKHLEQNYQKFDVIVLSVIDFDFRHQRPQHFANMFAKRGHRVFYFNANHHRDFSINLRHENLHTIDIWNPTATAIYNTDWSTQINELESAFDTVLNQHAIRDAVVIVDYPNWVNGAEYLRRKFGFKIITDYMDDFTGFLNPSEELIRNNCIKLLSKSDCVVASSQFLYDIAIKHNKNVEVIRNGTEYDFFARAHTSERQIENDTRRVIGYYGAISHWFAHDIVCYIAKNMPECDLILIGEVTAYQKELERFSNIKLLGEKPYNELPGYLKDFDVCLIPFDTSTDLIKATNPVKFYEYLSAGKKIVATEIPELKSYKDEYVLMSNDKETFLTHVKDCLNGMDTLKDSGSLMEMGRQNTWETRFESFVDCTVNMVPKVSVVVLTYNNLKLNKLCIGSILEKTAYPNFELIVVDNKSTDGTIEYLKNLQAMNISNLRIILNDENLGFAAGNNVGIRQSDGDYVIILNNDTIVTRGWMNALVKHLENDKAMGMSGSVTNSIGNEAKINTNYTSMSAMHYFADTYTWTHMGEIYHQQPNVLALFATCIKREVIDKCGYLDESYSIGMFEDDDYAQAVKQAGYKLCIAEDSFVHHFDGSSFKKMEDNEYRKLFNMNMEIFNKKWGIKWKAHEYREGVFGGAGQVTIDV